MKTAIIAMFLSVIFMTTTSANVPAIMNYQAYVTDALGAPLDGTVSIRAVLWADPTDSSQDSYRYGEAHANVQVDQGLFNIRVGTGTPDNQGDELEPAFFDEPLWMEISINGEDLTPRRHFGSTAYSFLAQTAAEVRPQSVSSLQVVNNSLTGNDIADGSLSQADLSDSSIANFSGDNQIRFVTNAQPEVVRSVTIVAPAAGFVLATASATAFGGGAVLGCSLTEGLTLDPTHEVESGTFGTTGLFKMPMSLTRGFLVAAGSRTINFVCQVTSGQVGFQVLDSAMTALFVAGS